MDLVGEFYRIVLEEKRMTLDWFSDFPAARETEFAVEFSGVVELKNVFRLIREGLCFFLSFFGVFVTKKEVEIFAFAVK